MIRLSTYLDELYEFYELHHVIKTDVSGTTITITGKLPHADAISSSGHRLHRTQIFVNNTYNAVEEVAASGADTEITVADTITLGDSVEIFLATSTGTLQNNALTGKFPVTAEQLAQRYAAESNELEIGACGSEQFETVRFSDEGEGIIAFKRQGNANMQNFILAKENGVYLMIIVKDTTDAANTTYDILHEVEVASYARGTQAQSNKKGAIADTVEFDFMPPAAIALALQRATSYDDATLSGTPTIIKLQAMDGTYYYTKAYPTASATAGEVADPIGEDVMGIDNATLSGVPRVFGIINGDRTYYFTAYPTISSEVMASAGLIPAPESFTTTTTISGTPRLLAIPIAGTNQYMKAYPQKIA